jgi:hypothetical protein
VEVFMHRVAVVGSGITGLLTAHGLRRAGMSVTLFSDRTAEQWVLGSKPTGTAGRFEPALSYERELGLAHWEAEARWIEGIHLTFCQVPGNRLVTLTGRPDKPGLAIDVRLQSRRWMEDLEARGGKVVIEAVTPARLDAIAAEHDLTVVATGKAELSGLFERDPARSVYDRPQRNLAMMVVTGPAFGFPGVPFLPVKFNLFGTLGEAFWVPYHSRHGACWNLLFEAKEGGPMDVFQGARSGREVVALGKQVIKELVPWDYAWAKDMELADEHGWLVGRVTPTVRRPVARLPSGRLVTGVGDTLMLMDPIAGQGANNGTKMARHFVERVVARGDLPFDEAWMTETFESFYLDHGRATYTFTSLLLEPMTAAGKELLIAQYGSDGVRHDGKQAIADAFCGNFPDPRRYTHLLTDTAATRRFIEEKTGQSWWRSVVPGALGVAKAQIRQMLGMPPNHPAAPAAALDAVPQPAS